MTKEVLKMALEALKGVLDDTPKVLDASIAGGLYEVVQCRDAITAIKEALAQPERSMKVEGPLHVVCQCDKCKAQPEPVAWEQFYPDIGKPQIAFNAEVIGYVAPQRTWVGLDWLPKHRCGLHLSHNEHRDVYETVEEFYDVDSFISMEELAKAISEDSVWVLHWYPETPIGFHRIAASTLEAIEAKLKEKNNG